MKEIRKCVVCGKTFTGKKTTAKYCSEECSYTAYKEMQRIRDRNKRKKELAERRKKADNRKSISDYAAEARAAGMSYGERQKQETLERMARRA